MNKKQQIPESEQCLRFNQNKIDPTMVIPEFEEELSKVMMFGAIKYERDNWKKGSPYNSVLASIQRHVWQLRKGEDIDQESKLPHYAHITANCMFLCYMDKNPQMKNKFDNRNVKKIKLENAIVETD